MTFDAGFDFRATAGYVTDPSACCVVLGEQYPHTYSLSGGGTAVAGWDIDNTAGCRDRDNAVDPRLAGINFRNTSSYGPGYFQVDLPATGSYDLHVAAGDATTGGNIAAWEFVDGTTIFGSMTSGFNTAGQFTDATDVVRTSAADWVANEVKLTHTFTSTTFKLRIMSSDVGSTVIIAHVRLTAAGASPTYLDEEGVLYHFITRW